MKFSERLKEVMIYKGLKQKDIAEVLNIDQSNISNWLNSKKQPSLETFYRLCKMLNESADYMLGLSN